MIDLVGLSEVAKKRTGGFCLGMGRRLGIASALLGDPRTIILDEPINGLDPEGTLVGAQPAQGPRGRGTHRLRLLAPDERDVADCKHLVVIWRGELIADVDEPAVPCRLDVRPGAEP